MKTKLKKKIIVCIYFHTDQCVLNKHKQCIKGFKYKCSNCDYGLESIYDKCYNNQCVNHKKI